MSSAGPASHLERVDGACDRCHRRSWLLGRLGGHLETARANISAVLALADEELIEAIGGRRRSEVHDQLRQFDAPAARRRCQEAGLEPICRCDERYPASLLALEAPPATLHVAGAADRFLDLIAGEPVAVVGARKASEYGLELARSLGRGLAASGVSVISGMATGIDSAAHLGALDGGALTVAVLPGPADRPYPPSRRGLFAKLRARGAAVSELPPGSGVWRWTFPARNRIIAALAAATVVVEAGAQSGALLTAGIARSLGKPIGAVPGRVTSPLAAGPNTLLAAGASVIRDPQDALDLLFGAGVRRAPADERPRLDAELFALLSAIGEGVEGAVALRRVGLGPDAGLAALAELELGGWVRRQRGGRFTVVP